MTETELPNQNFKVVNDSTKANRIEKVYYNVKIKPDDNKNNFNNSIRMLLIGCVVPIVLTTIFNLLINPTESLMYMLFMPTLIAAIVAITWFFLFSIIGGKYAWLAWDLFWDKTKGIAIRGFKSNQIDIRAEKIEERIDFIPGNKLTSQQIMEENLQGSANFPGRVVALMVQDELKNVNLTQKFPREPTSKDFNAAVMNGFDAGVFFSRVFESSWFRYLMIGIFVIAAISVISLYFGMTSSGYSQMAVAKVNDFNAALERIISDQAFIKQAIQNGSSQVIQG